MYLDVMMLLLFSRALFNNLGRYSTTQSFIDSSIIFLLSICINKMSIYYKNTCTNTQYIIYKTYNDNIECNTIGHVITVFNHDIIKTPMYIVFICNIILYISILIKVLLFDFVNTLCNHFLITDDE